jgi:hypothetical protein
MNLQNLIAELQADPKQIGYAGMTLAQLMSALFTPRADTIITRPQIPKATALGYLTAQGILASIYRAAHATSGTPTPEGLVIQSICLRIWLVLSDASYSVFDLSEPGSADAIDALVAAGLVTAAQRNGFAALQQVPACRAEAIDCYIAEQNDLVKAANSLGWQV